MDLSLLIGSAVILLTFLPAFLEILRLGDRGPRAFPEKTAHWERLGLISVLERIGSKARGRMTGGVSVIERDEGAGKLPSETLERVLRRAEELLREAEALLGER